MSYFLFILLFLLVSCVLLVHAFRPPKLSEELGCSPTLSILLERDFEKHPFFFDPLQIATDQNFPRLRECELKHGRIAMVAVVETIVMPLLKKSFSGGQVTLPPTSLLEGIKSVTLADAAKVIILCGALETLVLTQPDPKAMPGDYGIGYFGVRDKGANERNLIIELENGRLAMLAIVGQLLAELLSGGQSWDEQWSRLLQQWLQHITR